MLSETHCMRKKSCHLSEHIFFMIHTNELDASSCRIKIPSNILICNHKLEDCLTNCLKFNYTFLK